MKKLIVLTALLLFSINVFADRDYTCPAQIVCGTADSKNRCFVGQRVNKIFTITNSSPGYPGYIVDGTYTFTNARALNDPIKKYAPGIVTCNYASEEYPSINIEMKSDAGFYDDKTANDTGWRPCNENESSCFNNTPGTPDNCLITMKVPVDINE